MLTEQQIQEIRQQIDFEFKRKSPPAGFPKFPDVPAGRYNDPDFFELENKHYWRKTWMLAATLDDIPNPGDYMLWELARQPIVIVHGKDGEVRSFYNTCRHRGAPVVTEQRGHAEHGLVCNYHGWTYNHQGDLIGIRDKRDFIDFDFECRSLYPVRTERYGKLIFVNFDDEAMPLLQYLGPIADEWKEFQFDKLRLVDHYIWDLNCNWKIAIEANMEVYHVKSIHPQTVDPALDYRGNVNTLYPHGHSRMVAPNRVREKRGGYASAANHLPQIDTVGEIGRTCTQSYHVEPNWVSPLGSTLFPVLNFWPVSIRETKFELRWFAMDWGNGPVPAEWRQHIEWFNVVVTEDTQFGDWIQKSVESYAFKGVPLCYQEARIYHMHQNIDKIIGPNQVPAHLKVDPVLTDEWIHPNDTNERLRQQQSTAAE
jgi:phenylpropionate dioxygenase-like ring-hydroxylating dioxygenase large terminal subunit